MRKSLLFWLCVLFVSCQQNPAESNSSDSTSTQTKPENITEDVAQKNYQRLVVINPLLIEIIRAIGQEKKIVAYGRSLPSDTAFVRPKVGYRATLQAQYILEHKPDVVISFQEDSPEKVVDEITQANIEYKLFARPKNIEELKNTVNTLGKMLAAEPQAENLLQAMDSTLQAIQAITSQVKDSVRIIYLHVPAKETVMASGLNTPIDVILGLSGAKNACDFFDDVKRLDPEVMQAANASFILITEQSWEMLGGKAGASQIPALLESYAFRADRIIILENSNVLDINLNTPAIVLDLAQKLYGRR